MKKRNWKAALPALILAGMFWAAPLTAQAAPVLPKGVTAGAQSLEGMTQEEALEVLRGQYESRKNRTLSLELGEEHAEISGAELGLVWNNEAELQETLESYTGGSLIRRYMNQKDLEAAPVSLSPVSEANSEQLAAVIRERFPGLSEEPVNASIVRENEQFTITEGQPGETLDLEATKRAVDQALAAGESADAPISVVLTRQEPQIRAEDLSTIRDVLGTFTTDFGSSGQARSTNLSVGAAKINGRVLMPGEVISGYECLQPFTTANGYKTAAAYENGRVVDSIGGGVCQIATTLYNAALEAELEIVQRQNHSMIVTYVPPSRDAAIAGTVKDIKIKNNYPTPIYVEGYTAGKKLTFTIYGQETRPENRTGEYVSETLSTTDPGAPQMVPDAGLAPGAKVRVQSAHTGRKSRLWKVVSVDGKEVERTLLNEDTYNASKAIYRVGPDAPPPVPQPEETPSAAESETPTLPAPAVGVNGGPGVTAPASPEEAPQ